MAKLLAERASCQEMARVCRADGRILLLEQVIQPSPFLDRLSFHFYSLTTCPKNGGNFIVHGLLGLYTFAKKNTHSGKTRAFARFSASAIISSFALSMTVSKSLRVRTLPAKGGGIFLKVPG